VDARVKPGHDVEWRAGGRERILSDQISSQTLFSNSISRSKLAISLPKMSRMDTTA